MSSKNCCSLSTPKICWCLVLSTWVMQLTSVRPPINLPRACFMLQFLFRPLWPDFIPSFIYDTGCTCFAVCFSKLNHLPQNNSWLQRGEKRNVWASLRCACELELLLVKYSILDLTLLMRERLKRSNILEVRSCCSAGFLLTWLANPVFCLLLGKGLISD